MLPRGYRRRLVWRVGLLVGVCAGGLSPGRAEWTIGRTPSFELISEVGPERGEEVLRWLETFRHAVKARLQVEADRRIPTTVFLFANDASYGPYKPVVAGEVSSRSGHLHAPLHRVVLAVHNNVSDDLFQAQLFHHYAHALIAEAGFRPAPWLEEGLAAVMGSFRVQDNGYAFLRYHADVLPIDGVQAPVGHMHNSYVEEYRTMQGSYTRLRRLADYGRIIREGNAAADLHHFGASNLYYLQSWLLVHYALFSEDRLAYGPRLWRYALAPRGDDEAQLDWLEKAMGMNERKLRRQLERYYEGGRWTDLAGPIPGVLQDINPRWTVGSAPRMAEELAMLSLLSRPSEETRAAVAALPGSAEGSSRPTEALAAEAWARGDAAGAVELARAAVAAGSINSTMFTLVAQAALDRFGDQVRQAGVISADAAADIRMHFERAVALDPGNEEAWSGLAWLEAQAVEIDHANTGQLLERITTMKRPELALAGLAVVRWRIGDEDTARQWVTQLEADPDWSGAGKVRALAEAMAAAR